MLSSRALRLVALFASAAVGVSCGDYTGSTSPATEGYTSHSPTRTVAASFAYLPREARARAVRWAPSHSSTEQSVSALIGPLGGTLSLPMSDFTMMIPEGALAEPVTITVTSVAGAHVVYDMQPHGLQFIKPVTAVQDLGNTSVYGTKAASMVRSAYLPEGRTQIGTDGLAAPAELQAATTLFYGENPVAETHVWTLNHFSRFILISGVWVVVKD